MAKQLVRTAMILIAVGGIAAAELAAQTPIAHWSFDATLSGNTNNGSVYPEDSGLHNGTIVANGTATVTSVAGQFGNALNLNNTAGAQATNNAYVSFPNLTEIMGTSAGSYSVASWVKLSETTQQNTIIADWGNSATGNRFVYWFKVAPSGGSGFASAQTRYGTAGSNNIFNATAGPAITNDAWHHIVWSWNKIDGDSGVLTGYVDGIAQTPITVEQTAPATTHLMQATSTIGTIGRKADTNNYYVGAIDEVWVFNDVLSQAQVTNLFQSNALPGGGSSNLSLEVNAVSGAVTMRNTTANPIAISSYRITSNGQSLDTSGWDPLATGTPVDGFPQGTGNGNGWELAPNANSKELEEWFLTSSSTIASDGSVGLGNASFPTMSVGDHDNNGVVDTADYVVWRKNGLDQTQYNNWRSNFGKRKGTQDLVFQYTLGDGTVKTGTVNYVTSGSGAAISAVFVPEPVTAGMVLVAVLFGVLGRGPRQRI